MSSKSMACGIKQLGTANSWGSEGSNGRRGSKQKTFPILKGFGFYTVFS